jgi:hypothetical protein
LADDDPARKARDDATTQVRQECIDLREILIGMFGAAMAARALPEAVPRDPVMVAQYAKTIENNLAQITLPASRIPGASLDKAATITRIGMLRQTLDDALQLVAREVREAQATQTAKDTAMDAFDRSSSMGADVTSALLRLGGMPEQAPQPHGTHFLESQSHVENPSDLQSIVVFTPELQTVMDVPSHVGRRKNASLPHWKSNPQRGREPPMHEKP